MKNILILGCGGHARETLLHLIDCDKELNFSFYDDFFPKDEVQIKGTTYLVLKNFEDAKKKGFNHFVVGVGHPSNKVKLTENALRSNLTAAPTFIHPKAVVQDAMIGVGGLIAPGVVVTTNIKIGDYVILNYNSTIGHDSIIGNYSTCNPSCSISGNTHIGKSVFFGVNASTKEGIKICDNVTIGGQSFVNKNIEDENSIWGGVPARKLK